MKGQQSFSGFRNLPGQYHKDLLSHSYLCPSFPFDTIFLPNMHNFIPWLASSKQNGMKIYGFILSLQFSSQIHKNLIIFIEQAYIVIEIFSTNISLVQFYVILKTY